ncbi:MAG: radical SAM protein [Candidatus Nealsonbacteria bacterium]
MISHFMQKKWKYLAPIVTNIPDKPLMFAAKKFVNLQKQELIGDKMPKRAMFLVTKKCNLRCKHCFYMPHISSAPEMSFYQIQQLASSVKNNLEQIVFAGGEPFLRDDFSDIVLSFIKNGCRIVAVDTNGTLIEKVRLFLEKILSETRVKLSFVVSLDGPPAIHDDIRQVQGASEKTMRTIALLSDYYQKYPSRFGNIIVSTSINRLNLAYLPEIIDQIKPFKNIVHSFNFTRSANLHTFGVPQDLLSGFDVNKDVILNIDEMKSAFKCLDAEAWKTKNIPLIAFSNRQIMIEVIRLLEKRSTGFSCLAGKTEVIVYPEGDVGICEMLKPVGNLEETGYDLIKFYKQHREQFQAARKCSCTHDCNVMSSIRFSPSSIVELIKRKKTW